MGILRDYLLRRHPLPLVHDDDMFYLNTTSSNPRLTSASVRCADDVLADDRVHSHRRGRILVPLRFRVHVAHCIMGFSRCLEVPRRESVLDTPMEALATSDAHWSLLTR